MHSIKDQSTRTGTIQLQLHPSDLFTEEFDDTDDDNDDSDDDDDDSDDELTHWVIPQKEYPQHAATAAAVAAAAGASAAKAKTLSLAIQVIKHNRLFLKNTQGIEELK